MICLIHFAFRDNRDSFVIGHAPTAPQAEHWGFSVHAGDFAQREVTLSIVVVSRVKDNVEQTLYGVAKDKLPDTGRSMTVIATDWAHKWTAKAPA